MTPEPRAQYNVHQWARLYCKRSLDMGCLIENFLMSDLANTY